MRTAAPPRSSRTARAKASQPRSSRGGSGRPRRAPLDPRPGPPLRPPLAPAPARGGGRRSGSSRRPRGRSTAPPPPAAAPTAAHPPPLPCAPPALRRDACRGRAP
eukprot:5342861-Pyramimonas_sp.AAC.3